VPQRVTKQEFERQIQAAEHDLDIFRKEKHREFIKRQIVSVLILTGGVLWLLFDPDIDTREPFVLPVAIALCFGFLAWWTGLSKKEYRQEIKRKIYSHAIASTGLFYDVDGMIPAVRLRPMDILPRHDEYAAQDYFRGKNGDADFEFCEAHFLYRHITQFYGLLLMLELPEARFSGHTVIRSRPPRMDGIRQKIRGMFGFPVEGMPHKLQKKNMKPHPIGDPALAREFIAFTDNAKEAEEILNTQIPEYLSGRLKSLYRSGEIAIVFYGTSILIMSSLERPIFEPGEDAATPAAEFGNIKSVLRAVMEFLPQILSHRIFRRRVSVQSYLDVFYKDIDDVVKTIDTVLLHLPRKTQK